MLIAAIKVLTVILAILLVVLILLQQGKGSDLGSAFGGGSSNSIFGAVGPADFLGKLTSFIAAAFLILTFAHAYIQKQENTQELFDLEELTEEVPILPNQ